MAIPELPGFPLIMDRVTPFVEKRRKTTGGFGATPRLPATIDDTYFALRILALARPNAAASIPQDQALRAYLIGAGHSLHLGINTRYHLLAACRLAGLAVDSAATLAHTLSALTSSASLATWLYGIAIIHDILNLEPRTVIDAGQAQACLEPPWRTIDEAMARIKIQNSLGLMSAPSAASALASWLQNCQSGDGGFGFMPGTTSFVENCRYGLEALTTLGAQPRDRTAAIAFLCGCQTASGGFSRKGRATAFLDTSWHAVAALAAVLAPRHPTPEAAKHPRLNASRIDSDAAL